MIKDRYERGSTQAAYTYLVLKMTFIKQFQRLPVFDGPVIAAGACS